ncbi:MAG: ABC transporter ATP-binding protein [Planctomycetota bacterium]|nr:MAG: ABC transporter ATP-binding protein [Planctomycetota bacterium]
MKNFYRVISLAFRHKLTVAASLLCSLAVAVLWGGNITAIYPVVDVIMLNKSIPQYVDEKSAELDAHIAAIDARLADLRGRLPGAAAKEQSRLKAEISDEQFRRTKKLSELTWYRDYAAPLAHRWLPTTPFRTLFAVCGFLVVGTFLKSVFRVLGAYYTSRLGHLIQFELRKEFYRKTLRLDLATFRQTSPGDFMNRILGDVGAAALGAQNVFGMAIREPMKVIVCLIGAAWVSWQLLLITLISVPLAAYAIQWLAKSLKRANRKAIQEFAFVFDRIEEMIGGFKVIKAFTQESHERSRFHRTSKQVYKRWMRIAMYDSLVSPLTETMGILIIVAAVLCGGYLVLNQQTHLFGIRISEEPLTHGWLTLFYAMLAGASDPGRRLTAAFNSLQQGAAAADHLYELMDRQSALKDPERPKPLPDPLGAVEFNNVTFAYRPAEPVLRSVSLRIEPGETVAVIGPNGCGKSTLMNLMTRFYDPASGSICVSGIDVRDVRRRDLLERIGLVTQETLLFDDTVAENIRYGRFNASRGEIEEAARRAHAHRFITEQLKEGYETRVGPGGNRLSGGQRQRIALARAILRDPDLLILDEATSQIDVESEQLIHEVLAEFTRGRTAIIITHRPSTLALAHRIVVMEAGRIVDVGTYDQLAGRCQLFRRLSHLELREAA